MKGRQETGGIVQCATTACARHLHCKARREYGTPDSFVEFGVNVTRRLAMSLDSPAIWIRAVWIRMAEDIATSTFRSLGYWARASAQ